MRLLPPGLPQSPEEATRQLRELRTKRPDAYAQFLWKLGRHMPEINVTFAPDGTPTLSKNLRRPRFA